MKKHSSILALVVMSCNLPLILSTEPQAQRDIGASGGDRGISHRNAMDYRNERNMK